MRIQADKKRANRSLRLISANANKPNDKRTVHIRKSSPCNEEEIAKVIRMADKVTKPLESNFR